MPHAAQLIVSNVEKRAARRRSVECSGFVREPGARIFSVEVTDLSQDGCRFRSCEPFETATNIWLKIAGLTAREARIIWRDATAYGCEFLKPLRQDVLDDLFAAGR